MHQVTIPKIGAADAWRNSARSFLTSGVPPDQIIWGGTSSPVDLFATHDIAKNIAEISVPRSFMSLANTAVWHSDPERFARLYAFLWRLQDHSGLMEDRGDADLARLRQMEKNVRRCKHKMKAFLRFREVGPTDAARRSFAAWFEPTHFTVEPTADFFARRFGDMDWCIFSPDVSAIFKNGQLSFTDGRPKPDLPDDATEELWITYFRNIFNPARLKIKAMQSEMPKKYWKNMPEAAAIPDLIANAPARAMEMARAMPTLPPARMAQIQSQLAGCQSAWSGPAEALNASIAACTRCPLHACATQAVIGEGPSDAKLMIVGEQPGDQEDLTGRPFVGPAGKLFDKVADDVGLDRRQAYVTNAVKHFKFQPRGKRRIHQRPNTSEIDHCRWWLDAEVAKIKPKLILTMGATAAQAITGTGQAIMSRRGKIEYTPSGQAVFITLHPSYLLRTSQSDAHDEAMSQFRDDLRDAAQWANQHSI